MYIILGDHFNEFKVKGSLFKAYTFKVNNIIDIKTNL